MGQNRKIISFWGHISNYLNSFLELYWGVIISWTTFSIEKGCYYYQTALLFGTIACFKILCLSSFKASYGASYDASYEASLKFCFGYTVLLHMCFERFLLAFESRDLSQADNRITRVSSFPSFNFWMINYSYPPFGTLAKLFWSIYHSKVSKLKN